MAAQDRVCAQVHIRLGRRPVRYRYAHHGAALPDAAAEPASAFLLDAADNVTGQLIVIAEADEDLVQAHLVQHCHARLCVQRGCEAPGVG